MLLSVVAAFAEPGQDNGTVAEAALAELHRLRQWLGLEHLSVGEKGGLVPHLRAVAGPLKARAGIESY